MTRKKLKSDGLSESLARSDLSLMAAALWIASATNVLNEVQDASDDELLSQPPDLSRVCALCAFFGVETR